jgi:hypothetical protein
VGRWETFIYYGVQYHNMTVTKSITIREDQNTWIHDNALCLSRFIQLRIDDMMDKENSANGEE